MSRKKSRLKDTEYLYVSARLKALETKNITKEKFEKMIESKSVGDAIAVLAECEYGGGNIAASDRDINYEQLFAAEQRKIYDLIADISPNPALLDFFKHQSDCHNIKSILKSEFMNRNPDELLISAGKVDIADAKTAVRERTFAGYSQNISSAAMNAVDAFSKNRDPMIIDIIIDKACFADMLETAEESRCPFLTELAEIKIDLVNIMTAVRVMRMKNTLNLLKMALIPGGNIPESFFIDSFDIQESKLYDALKHTDYTIVSDFAAANQGQPMLSQLEKLCDEIYCNKIKSAQFISFGAEVVVGYIAAKEAEIKNARIVMRGKEASLPGDIIRERLRAVYA